MPKDNVTSKSKEIYGKQQEVMVGKAVGSRQFQPVDDVVVGHPVRVVVVVVVEELHPRRMARMSHHRTTNGKLTSINCLIAQCRSKHRELQAEQGA